MSDLFEWLEELHKALKSIQCKVKNRLSSIDLGVDCVRKEFEKARENTSTVWWIGNGGSVSICSHLSQDLINKLKIRSQLLSDPSLMTCMANDYGYANVYLQPLKTMARKDDVLIAISSSGKSQNILSCASFAIDTGMRLITFSGFAPQNPLWNLESDISFYLPSNLYGQVEVGHEALLHAVIDTMLLKGI